MNNALTQDDLSDLDAVARGARTPAGDRCHLRASQLDDHGAKLLSLGLVEVAVEAVYGIPGSERLETTDAGLDELFERERATRLRRAAHAQLAA